MTTHVVYNVNINWEISIGTNKLHSNIQL